MVQVLSLAWNKLSDDEYVCYEWDYRLTSGADGCWGVSPVDWPAFSHPYKSLDEAMAAANRAHSMKIRSAIVED